MGENITSEHIQNWSDHFLSGSRYWIQRVLLPIVAFIGVFGNVIAIIVLTRKRMKSSTNTYLTALAVSDIVILLAHVSLSLAHYDTFKSVDYIIYWRYWRFGLWLGDAASGVSVWLTVSFTVERYIAVCHPLKGKVLCTESRARKIIVLVFLLCPLSVLSTPFEHYVQVHINPDTQLPVLPFVHPSPLGLNETYKTIFYWFTAITFVFVPLILLTTLNSFLINAVHRSRRHRHSLTQVEHGGSYKQRQENKITMILVAVVFLFIVCQMPQVVVLILNVFYDPPKGTVGFNVLRAMGNIFNFLMAVNAASNFILYCAMSDRYRRTMILTFFPFLAKSNVDTNTLRSNASFRLSSVRISVRNSLK